MHKYATLNNISAQGTSRFGEGFEKTDSLEDAGGIIVRSAKMHDMVFSDNLLAIARAGAGVNNIPVKRCTEEGIVVFNTPGANANGVKELVITAMLLASRDIIGGVNWVVENAGNKEIAAMTEKEKKKFAGTELSGKKIGIIGLGAIGVRVANAAVHLGMEVYGYDPYLRVDSAWNMSSKVTYIKDIERIYRKCDFITIHVPAMESTRHYIDEKAIDMMRHGVVVINMARDMLVDEDAMARALADGKVRKYVSDFPNPAIAGHKGCITIPHLGASTREAETNCAVMAVEQMKTFLNTGSIVNSVNFPNCSLEKWAEGQRITIYHKNINNMINSFTNIISEAGINISAMANKSREDYAYTALDLDSPVSDDVTAEFEKISGVIRVRVI
ncbi:MAG: phosphoglycerate dehydrogenase [Hornefia sp.]|nr:phosphoglycerate dehydrogenase [Hornefia sp.]